MLSSVDFAHYRVSRTKLSSVDFAHYRVSRTKLSSVDFAHYRVSRAKDWVSVDCGTKYHILLFIEPKITKYDILMI